MFYLSESAVREAVRNAKRERSERGACSAADAVAVSGSVAVAVREAVRNAKRERSERGACSAADAVAVSVGRRAGSGVSVCDCRAVWRMRVVLMVGYGSYNCRRHRQGGGWGLWPSALAVGLGRA